MSARHEWLGLVEVSGPFLAEPVLDRAFPQGMERLETARAQRLRAAYEERREAVDAADDDLPAVHRAWIDEALATALDLDEEVLRSGEFVPAACLVELVEHGVALGPDLAVVDSADGDRPLLMIHVYDPDSELMAAGRFGDWSTTPAERMTTLLRRTECPLGLVTNGEQWMLVHAPEGTVPSFGSWYARLWSQEPDTLRAFVSLLGVRRLFGPAEEQLPKLFEQSTFHQDEVTEALGEQVRRAVEVLVQALDRADQDRNRELLADVEPKELYDAALTVMMRLVFLLSAEERGLLLLGETHYDAGYAVSTLRTSLLEEPEEVLERRRSAWSRLLATFRIVYGGIEHPALRLPPLGGSLFDPDRYPFLEGRAQDSDWRSSLARPLPIDDRTVLLLLGAIQTFRGRTLSYRGLDVEQIGYVYEGLLERTVERADEVRLELDAAVAAENPVVLLGELESAVLDGRQAVEGLLSERSARELKRVRRELERPVDALLVGRLLSACGGDEELKDRVLPYLSLVRLDPWGVPLVRLQGAYSVVLGTSRRDSQTHYTPKSLTERIVDATLEPLAFDGAAEGRPRDQWVLRSAAELAGLKVCDPAMGSGAFLVQACRWLADRLVEAWCAAEASGRVIDAHGELLPEGASDEGERLSPDAEERRTIARRIVAERCLYGVDLNPTAVELTKLSLWLVTLSKNRPFEFLDHHLMSGDSLVGITDLEQLNALDLHPSGPQQQRLFGDRVLSAVSSARALRDEMAERRILDIRDVSVIAGLEARVEAGLELPKLLADAFMATVYRSGGDRARLAADVALVAAQADEAVDGDESATAWLRRISASLKRTPLHWPLAFPEVFADGRGGFDAVVGNPPFLGNRLWKRVLGEKVQLYFKALLGVAPGKVDLSAIFHRRAVELIRAGGTYGMLAASNIAQGSAIKVGLGEIVRAGDIIDAEKGLPWPGKAAVFVAIVVFFKGVWQGERTVAGSRRSRIGARLDPEEADAFTPKKLKSAPFAFEGVNNSKGLAFVLSPDDEWFEPLRDEPESLLRPYVTGDDITSSALTRLNRWALDIGDRRLEEIEEGWPMAYQFLQEVVRPTRTPDALKSYKGLVDRWWQFWNHRAEPLSRLRKHSKFVSFSKVTKYPICMLADSSWIYTNQVLLIALERPDLHPIALSSFFTEWLERYCGGGMGETLRLSIREGVATFPMPRAQLEEQAITNAKHFQERAVAFAKRNSFGMTGVMNGVHAEAEYDDEIAALRALLVDIDRITASAYGWDDVAQEREFVVVGDAEQTQWRVRQDDRAEIIERLLQNNNAQG